MPKLIAPVHIARGIAASTTTLARSRTALQIRCRLPRRRLGCRAQAAADEIGETVLECARDPGAPGRAAAAAAALRHEQPARATSASASTGSAGCSRSSAARSGSWPAIPSAQPDRAHRRARRERAAAAAGTRRRRRRARRVAPRPFAGELHDGYVWGRGALDMKGGVAMMLAAFMRATAAPTPPPGDVILCVLCDEEAGSDLGASFLVSEHAELFERRALRDRRVRRLHDAGRRPALLPDHGRREAGLLDARDAARARRARLDADPRRRDGQARRSCSRALDRRRLPVHVTPVVRSMVEAIAAELPAASGAAAAGPARTAPDRPPARCARRARAARSTRCCTTPPARRSSPAARRST